MFEILQESLSSLTPAFKEAGISSEELDSGLESIRFGLGRLGMEAGHAEAQGISMTDAVANADRFPSLCRFHLLIIDILAMEIPSEFLPLTNQIMEMPTPPQFEAMHRYLASVAAGADNMPERALAGLLLFEAVRIEVVATTWEDRIDLIRLGIADREIDEITEAQVRTLIANADVLDEPEPIRPLPVLLTASLIRLGELAAKNSIANALGQISEQLQLECERRAIVEKHLQNIDHRDAVLIRNFFGPTWGEQRLLIDRVADLHPLLYQGTPRNTLDQRLSRRLRQAKEDPNSLPVRRRPTLIDLFLKKTRGKK